MKQLMFILSYLLASTILHGQTEITLPISEVTIYHAGADVTRTGNVTLSAGKNTLIIRGISNKIDVNSLRSRLVGDAQLLSINTKLDSSLLRKKDMAINKLREEINTLNSRIDEKAHTSKLQEAKLNLINSNIEFANHSGYSSQQLSSTLALYDQQLPPIYVRLKKIEEEIEELSTRRDSLGKKIQDINNNFKRGLALYCQVESPISTSTNLIVQYYTPDASWNMKYDLRADNVDKPLAIQYKAEISQHTGENWDNIVGKLSTARPDQSPTAPELDPWKLHYAHLTRYVSQPPFMAGNITGVVVDETGESLIGANVIYVGTQIGVSTDVNGFFKLPYHPSASQLSISYIGHTTQIVEVSSYPMRIVLNEGLHLEEAVVTGLGVKKRGRYNKSKKENNITAKDESQSISVTEYKAISKEFILKDNFSLRSEQESQTVYLQKKFVEPDYLYIAVPKKSDRVFLTATIKDLEKLDLVPGPAQIFFDNGYVGQTVINTELTSDSLVLSLGADPSVLIDRNLAIEYNEKKFLSSKIKHATGYDITVRNNKRVAIPILIKDQVPVSMQDKIVVDIQDIDSADFDKDTGILKWKYTLNTGESNEHKVRYQVEYPKKYRVNLE